MKWIDAASATIYFEKLNWIRFKRTDKTQSFCVCLCHQIEEFIIIWKYFSIIHILSTHKRSIQSGKFGNEMYADKKVQIVYNVTQVIQMKPMVKSQAI